MALATLSIDLVARLAEFERDMGKAARLAEQNAQKISDALGVVGRTAGAVLGGVTVGALVALTRAQVDAVDGFNDLKDATGASIENISALDSIARRAGASFDTVSDSLIKFNEVLSKAGDKDKGPGAVFKAIGLDAEKLKQLDPAEALRQTAVALAGFADDGNKARAVQELFGKSVREIAPWLIDLAEGGELVATRFTEQADAADEFNKQIFRVQAGLGDLGRDISLQVLPVVNAIGKEFAGASTGASGLASVLGGSLLTVLQTVTVLGSDVAFVFRGLGREIGAIAAQANAVARLDFRGAAVIREELIADNEADRAALDRFQRRILGLGETSAAAPAGATAKPSLNVVESTKPAKDAAADRLRKLVDDGKDLATSLAAQSGGLSPDFLDKWDKLSAAYKGNAISLDQLTEAQATLLKQQPFGKQELFAGDVTDALDRRLAAMERSRRALEEMNAELDRLADGGDERKRILTERLEARIAAGEVFTPEQLERMALGIAGISKATGEVEKSAVNFADVFESRFEAAIIKGEKLSGVLKSLAQDMLQLTLRESVTKPLASAAGSWFSSMFSFANGGVMTAAGAVPLHKYATGGVANSPQVALFGEGRTPEAFVPLPDGRRIPVAMKGGGRPIVIQNHMTVGDVASMEQVQAQLRESERRTANAIGRSLRYGGALA